MTTHTCSYSYLSLLHHFCHHQCWKSQRMDVILYLPRVRELHWGGILILKKGLKWDPFSKTSWLPLVINVIINKQVEQSLMLVVILSVKYSSVRGKAPIKQVNRPVKLKSETSAKYDYVPLIMYLIVRLNCVQIFGKTTRGTFSIRVLKYKCFCSKCDSLQCL